MNPAPVLWRHPIWAETFDTEPGTVGNTQDDVVHRIVTAIEPRLLDTERARGERERPGNPDALDLYLQARALYKIADATLKPKVVELCERALALDPTLVSAMALQAEASVDMLPGDGDPRWAETILRAEHLIARAEAITPDDLSMLEAKGFVLRMEDRLAEAVALLQRAVQLYPNSSELESQLGQCLIQLGRPADAIPHIERAIRLNPRSRTTYTYYRRMSEATGLLGRYEECASWAKRTLDANPSVDPFYRANRYARIAAADELLGRHDATQAATQQAVRTFPWITVRSFGVGYEAPEGEAQMAPILAALRRTGMRDHADEDADFGVPADGTLNPNGWGKTPLTVPGARTIRTQELAALLDRLRPIVLQATSALRSVPGTVVLVGAGADGTLSDAVQDRLRRKIDELTHGDHGVPVVAFSWNSERFAGRNLAVRLVGLGYTDVYWYRGGREAWEVAGLPETPADRPSW